MSYKAFTLSEVLITIVIIGVIAAITIPAVMTNTNAHEYKTAAKKAISQLNQALWLNYAFESLTDGDYSSGEQIVEKIFKKRLNVIEGEEKFTEGCDDGYVFTTDDGIIFCITSGFQTSSGTECNPNNDAPCGTEPNLYIDVNGAKAPNKLTVSSKEPKDIYEATIYAQKVVPYGYATQEVIYENNFEENQGGGSSNLGGGSEPEVKPNPGGEGGGEVEPEPELPEVPEYDPNRWPTLQEFLDWLRDVFGTIFG